jgi:Raf kinase inhibitor-like YbhB/YbcL family protein
VKKLIIIAGLIIIALFVIRFGLGGNEDDWICSNGAWVKHGHPVNPMPTGGCGDIKITSTAWENNAVIPKTYTCDGGNTSPPVAVSGMPAGTKSWVLVMTDPDAPGGTFTHWVMWNIGPHVTEIAEGKIPAGAVSGNNDFGKTGYGGPCPPSGRHHYRITVYALSDLINLPEGSSRLQLEKAMENIILGTGELTGLYR